MAKVAEAISEVCGNERHVTVERLLEDVGAAIHLAYLLSNRKLGVRASRREEAAEAGGGGPEPFRQSALRNQFELALAAVEGGLEVIIPRLSRKRRACLGNQLMLEEQR
jgi:hypothetical protein